MVMVYESMLSSGVVVSYPTAWQAGFRSPYPASCADGQTKIAKCIANRDITNDPYSENRATDDQQTRRALQANDARGNVLRHLSIHAADPTPTIRGSRDGPTPWSPITVRS